jgi:hypothetical protein
LNVSWLLSLKSGCLAHKLNAHAKEKESWNPSHKCRPEKMQSIYRQSFPRHEYSWRAQSRDFARTGIYEMDSITCAKGFRLSARA